MVNWAVQMILIDQFWWNFYDYHNRTGIYKIEIDRYILI